MPVRSGHHSFHVEKLLYTENSGIRLLRIECCVTDEGMPSEGEEERKLQEARAVKLRQLTGE